MKMQNEHADFCKRFIQELQDEVEFHAVESGTSYRRKTAELSLDVAKTVEMVSPLLKANAAINIVSRLMPRLDNHRLEDVSKMLNVIAKDIYMDATLSNEAKAYVDYKRENQKPITLKKLSR